MDDHAVIIEAIRRKAKETHRLEFKQTVDVSTTTSKAEFIRDVLSLGNSEGESPREPGFLVIGVKSGVVHGVGSTEYDGATLRQLIRSYIAPELSVTYSEFVFRRKTLGVLKLEPFVTALYVVAKDLPDASGRKLLCAGQSWGRKGDEKVRLVGQDFSSRVKAISLATAEIYVEPFRSRVAELEQVLGQSGPLADVRRLSYAIEADFDWESITSTLSKISPYLRDYRSLVGGEVLKISKYMAGRMNVLTPVSLVRQVMGLLYSCLPYSTFLAMMKPANRPLPESEQEIVLHVSRIAAEIALDGCTRLKNPAIIECCLETLHILLRSSHINGLEREKNALDDIFLKLERACKLSPIEAVRELADQFGGIRGWEALSFEEQERRRIEMEQEWRNEFEDCRDKNVPPRP